MVLQCVAAGSALVYLHYPPVVDQATRSRLRAAVGLLVHGRFDLVGGDPHRLLRGDLRLDRLQASQAENRRLGRMTPLLATSPDEEWIASGDSRGFAGRQRGPFGSGSRPLAAGRADHPLGPPAAGSLAGAGRAVPLPAWVCCFPSWRWRAVRAWMGPEAAQQAADQKPELAHPAEQLLRAGTPGENRRRRNDGRHRGAADRGIFLSCLAARLAGSRLEPPAAEASGIEVGPAFLAADRVAGRALRPDAPPLQQGAAFAGISGPSCFSGRWRPICWCSAWRLRCCGSPRGRRRPIWAGNRRNSAPTPNWASWPSWPSIGPVLTLQVALMVLVKWTGNRLRARPDPALLSGAGASACSIIARTGIAPSLVLHMAFNATSIVLCSFGVGASVPEWPICDQS